MKKQKVGGASFESSDGQYAEPIGDKENLQSISQERQAFIKEKLDKWCEELGYKDTTVNMFTLSRSLDISKNELSRYFTSCLNSTFRIWLAEVRFEAAKKMMLDYPDYSNDIISAECGFSSRSYLYRIFKEKEGFRYFWCFGECLFLVLPSFCGCYRCRMERRSD